MPAGRFPCPATAPYRGRRRTLAPGAVPGARPRPTGAGTVPARDDVPWRPAPYRGARPTGAGAGTVPGRGRY